jgi:PEP-CTERM motif
MKALLCGAAFAALCAAAPAQATVLYDDGPINGNFAGWTMNFGFAVGDTFTLAQNSKVNGVQNIGLWLFPNDSATSVTWSIMSDAAGNTIGTTIASGTANLSETSLGTNSFGYSLFAASFSMPTLNLGAGTYWLVLSGLNVPSGDPGYWDINGGPSRMWENSLGYDANVFGTACPGTGECSDPFQIVGGAAVPEPGSLALLTAGLAGFAGWRLRRKAKA